MHRTSITCIALALFAGSGWLYAFRAEGPKPRGSAQSMVRDASRIAYVHEDPETNALSVPAQFAVQYGAPPWKDEYDAQAGKIKAGQRVRLGKDFWTELDTNVPLTIAGQELAPNQYYLLLERGEGDGWKLIAAEASEIRAKHLDAFQSEHVTGGIAIPMTYSKAAESTDEMLLQFQMPRDGSPRFIIQWGPHQLAADVIPEL